MTQDLFSFAGRTAVVTGGSRGVGYMIAEGLLRAGAAEVIISSRKADVCEQAVQTLSRFGRCRAVPADLSTPEGVATLAAGVADISALHLLVNNAGATWGAPVDEYPDSGWDRVLNTNVDGVFRLTVALLDKLRAAASSGADAGAGPDPARVINIGSVDGIRPPAMESYAYSTSKAAVHMLTRHLAKRLAAEQITVNAIAPGPFESKMTAFMLEAPEAREIVEQAVPLGRIGTPDDIVGTTLFLASRAGAYVTGTVIPLDGGITGCG
jgi:NAD(P)-dependent dehydrogenase (short-subunit alcohol dehydrogenase family)